MSDGGLWEDLWVLALPKLVEEWYQKDAGVVEWVVWPLDVPRKLYSSRGSCLIRVHWFCKDLSARVIVKDSSCQHGNPRSWYNIVEEGLRYRTGSDFKSTLQDFRG